MGSITLLLGRTRWRRRTALPRAFLAGVDGFGRPRTLYVTDNARRKDALEREFVRSQGEQPSFEPRILLFTEMLETLALRHGGGRAILPHRALALLAQRVVESGGEGRWPWLSHMGSPSAVGEALALLHQQLAESDRNPLKGAPHEDELRQALGALDAAVRRVPGHVTRAQALKDLLDLLEDPPDALMEWLRGADSVIFDDLLQPTALRRHLLTRLAQAWAFANSNVFFTFEIGQDLGGDAAGLFFEYEDLNDVAWPLKPFAATRQLRRHLFTELIGVGSGDILVALSEGPVSVEPGRVFDGEPDPDLTDLMYRGEALDLGEDPAARVAALTGHGRLRLMRCADPDAELRFIARSVKRALLDGTRPGECAVALADLGSRADALRAVFTDHGIPFTLSGGQPLLSAPVARLLRRMAEVALRDYPAQELLDLLNSELIQVKSPLHPAGLLGWCRTAGVRGGHPSTWSDTLRNHLEFRHTGEELQKRLKRLSDSLRVLDEICELLAPLAQPATPEAFRDALLRVADRLGITRRVGTCEEHPELARLNLLAWGAALRQLDAMVQDLRVVHPGEWPAEDLINQLDQALTAATWQPDTGGASRVQVLTVHELRGVFPSRVWLGGLVRGAFPPAPAVTFLLPRAKARELQPLDPIAEARYLFCSLLRNALSDPEHPPHQVTLSWPTSRDGGALAPSPILEDLLSLPTWPGHVPLRERVVEDWDDDGEPLSRSDLLRAAARSPEWRALVDDEDRAVVDEQRLAAAARARSAPFGAYDGLLREPPELPPSLAVTALETFLRCPARYWYSRVMRLGPPEEWEPELAADRKGTAIHRILEAFLERVGLTPLQGLSDADEAARTLHQVATEVLNRVQQEGGFDEQLFRYHRERWLAGLVDDAPKGLLRSWLDAEIDGDLGLIPLAVEQGFDNLPLGPATLKGKIDRLDRVPGGILVTDYKTGSAPHANLVERGLALQPVVYAEAVAAHHPDQPVASSYYVIKDPESLSREGWVGDPQLIDALTNRRAVAKIDPLRRRRLLSHAAEAARRLAQGRFHTTLAGAKDAHCERCEFARVCRVDHERSERLDALRDDLQAPIPEEVR
ncbi:MAG: PD-(D/E)XK nuclease family protein [Alphaproteobacteria bacterium]|nr:PD-(D/E)XK nuclease family protein [Alphaproteobacteria bacterium]